MKNHRFVMVWHTPYEVSELPEWFVMTDLMHISDQ